MSTKTTAVDLSDAIFDVQATLEALASRIRVLEQDGHLSGHLAGQLNRVLIPQCERLTDLAESVGLHLVEISSQPGGTS
jgi:hypothetical protein